MFFGFGCQMQEKANFFTSLSSKINQFKHTFVCGYQAYCYLSNSYMFWPSCVNMLLRMYTFHTVLLILFAYFNLCTVHPFYCTCNEQTNACSIDSLLYCSVFITSIIYCSYDSFNVLMVPNHKSFLKNTTKAVWTRLYNLEGTK
jgi:hypothetical protein